MTADPCDKVLVVDDDRDVREALVDLLADGGYTATCASNGQEAIERLRRGDRPDVILLDLMMPVMDGFQFREAQTADPALNDIPVVLLSAHADVPAVASSMGVAAGLRKPFAVDKLLETLDRVCGPRPGSSAPPSA